MAWFGLFGKKNDERKKRVEILRALQMSLPLVGYTTLVGNPRLDEEKETLMLLDGRIRIEISLLEHRQGKLFKNWTHLHLLTTLDNFPDNPIEICLSAFFQEWEEQVVLLAQRYLTLVVDPILSLHYGWDIGNTFHFWSEMLWGIEGWEGVISVGDITMMSVGKVDDPEGEMEKIREKLSPWSEPGIFSTFDGIPAFLSGKGPQAVRLTILREGEQWVGDIELDGGDTRCYQQVLGEQVHLSPSSLPIFRISHFMICWPSDPQIAETRNLVDASIETYLDEIMRDPSLGPMDLGWIVTAFEKKGLPRDHGYGVQFFVPAAFALFSLERGGRGNMSRFYLRYSYEGVSFEDLMKEP
ncbi:MAG: hypothetical protein D6795_02450, partial [Deltaproteobacteria bacterium]